ncbi:hypothetical protein [Butyrivibrio proteoclasticus]|uniref:hypothetical protein n=1 Tax=Butyrivibrio proteoclasticus TaxID=43305 RepID=UPI000479BB5B|nr:hypothetical protein [Butyrivibrio proteoclasticus]
MNIVFNCDKRDAMVIVDKSIVENLTDEQAYSLDILLDKKGESELVFDFPGEDWNIVWERETRDLRNFINSGAMIVNCLDETDGLYSFNVVEEEIDACSCLEVKSGEVIIVSASELIQVVLYPELKMEKSGEMNLEAGWYEVKKEGNGFSFHKAANKRQDVNNII